MKMCCEFPSGFCWQKPTNGMPAGSVTAFDSLLLGCHWLKRKTRMLRKFAKKWVGSNFDVHFSIKYIPATVNVTTMIPN